MHESAVKFQNFICMKNQLHRTQGINFDFRFLLFQMLTYLIKNIFCCCKLILINLVLFCCCVWCTRSSVTRCTHFVALYLCLMCQSGLHAVLWSHISILLHLPAAEPRSIAGLLFPSQYLSRMIWLTPYLIVWDWRVSRAGPMPFCWPSCSLLFCFQLFSLSLLFLYRLVVWGWVFGLIGCQSPSPGLALPIFFNNDNNNLT